MSDAFSRESWLEGRITETSTFPVSSPPDVDRNLIRLIGAGKRLR